MKLVVGKKALLFLSLKETDFVEDSLVFVHLRRCQTSEKQEDC